MKHKDAYGDWLCVQIKYYCFTGPSQPDEDDYGYVSQEASTFYNQLMSKYNSLPPEKPIFNNNEKRTIKDITSTKVAYIIIFY